MLVKYMEDYFNETHFHAKSSNKTINENLIKIAPVYSFKKERVIETKPSKWERLEDSQSISRCYLFKTNKQREAFIVEMVKLTRSVDCLLTVSFSNEKEVQVTLKSYSPEVSEIEIETSRDIDKIRKDVVYYYATEK